MRWFVPFKRLQRYAKYLEISAFVAFIIVCLHKKAAAWRQACARSVSKKQAARWRHAPEGNLTGTFVAGRKLANE